MRLQASAVDAGSRARRRLETALLAFLVYGAFEGAVKRVFQYAEWIYPIKDGFFLLLLLAWILMPGGSPRRWWRVEYLCFGFLVVAVLEMFNSYLPSVIAGLAGFHASYMYAMLFFICLRIYDSEVAMMRLARWLGVIAIIAAAGAVGETQVGSEWIDANNLKVAIDASYMGASGEWALRPSSIGNGPGSTAIIEVIGTGFLFGLSAFDRRRPVRLLCLAGAALGITGVLLAATRVVWVMAAVGSGVAIVLIGRRRVAWAVAASLVLAVSIYLAIVFSSGEIVARYQTLETPVQTFQTERGYALAMLPEMLMTYPLGAGIGWHVPRQLGALSDFYAGAQIDHIGLHNYLSILAVEVGIAGLTLFILFTVAVLVIGLSPALSLRSDDRRWILLVSAYAVFAGYALSLLVGSGLIGWPGEYYWLLAGIVVGLARSAGQHPDASRSLREPGVRVVMRRSEVR